MLTDLKHVPVSQVRENQVSLRRVNRDSEDYLLFKQTIAQEGILNPINVREMVDEETGETYYSIIDGLHRYTAAKDLNLETIPVQVLAADDNEVMIMQLIGNASRFSTHPVQYTEHIQRILADNPTTTQADLAARLGQTPSWISQRLNLLKLTDELKPLVDSGEINLTNAYSLSKLPPEEQNNYMDQAMTMPPDQFAPIVASRVKEINTARRKGRTPKPAEFIAEPHQRKWKAIKDAYLEFSRGETKQAEEICAQMGAESALDGFYAALAWCTNMDPISVAAQKQRYEEDQERKRQAQEAKAKAREEAKREAAAKAVEAIS